MPPTMPPAMAPGRVTWKEEGDAGRGGGVDAEGGLVVPARGGKARDGDLRCGDADCGESRGREEARGTADDVVCAGGAGPVLGTGEGRVWRV